MDNRSKHEFFENTDICIHVPHALKVIPKELCGDFSITQDELEAEARISVDLYSDLLAKEAWPNAHLVEAKVSRIVIDVERGVLYECDHRGHPIRYVITSEKREKLLSYF